MWALDHMFYIPFYLLIMIEAYLTDCCLLSDTTEGSSMFPSLLRLLRVLERGLFD